MRAVLCRCAGGLLLKREHDDFVIEEWREAPLERFILWIIARACWTFNFLLCSAQKNKLQHSWINLPTPKPD